jgi:hypothetical protein
MKMKTIRILIPSLVILVVIMGLSGCHKDSPTPSEVNKKILSAHDWNLQTLSVDEVDKTSLYPGMTLSFTATSYATTHGAPVWPASGTWSFANSEATHVTRDDGMDITVEAISDTQLVLSMNWSKTTYGGRVSSIAGHHVFTFTK